jgi:hypothetical protein
MVLHCLTCDHFHKRKTNNDRLYLGRCVKQEVTCMICPPDEAPEKCDDYSLTPDAGERVADYKAWRKLHPLPVYELGEQALVDEVKNRPVPKQRGGKRK